MITGYSLSARNSDMDLLVIHGYLSQSHLGQGVSPLETLSWPWNTPLCFGVFQDSGEQVGFARMVTDKATFAYLADVFILEEHCRGFSKALMTFIPETP